MSYLVFARKFRPQRFEEVVGQEHIATTLQNAIKENRIAQSFLFSGTRGIGKTSTARILAKALNCEKGIVPEPCGECLSCQEITQGNSLDVLEIDGASNRGIDEIRNLRENVKFKPAQGRFKVYIIDEVHMLTQEAFNALLKTLEEPPEHVKFIFATTELHKVPLTILSRCQKFAFRKVPTASIVQKLEEIAKTEELSCDERSFFAIAKAADGSLRDAESLLDQMASFAKGKITYAKVVDAFGIPRDETYLALVDAILEKDPKKVLEVFAPLQAEGKDMVQFVRGLTEFFRALLILKVTEGSASELIDLSPEVFVELKLKKNNFSKEDLLSVANLLQNLLFQVRRSPLPHLHVETALIRLAVRENLISLAELSQKLEALSENPGRTSVSKSPPVSELREFNKTEREGSSLAATTKPETLTSASEENEPKALTVTESEPQGTPSISLNDVERVWAEVIDRVKAKKMSCGMFLSEAEPVEVDSDIVVVGLPAEFKFHKESLEKQDNRKVVEEILQSTLNAKIRISFVITVPEKTSLASSVSEPEQEKIPEIVESAIKLFEGKIIRRA